MVLIYLCMHEIPCALGCRAYLLVWWKNVNSVWSVSSFSPPFPQFLNFPLFISMTAACLLRDIRAHGWVVSFCQPSVQTPAWSWLPKVEVTGCLRHPTSKKQCSCQLLLLDVTRTLHLNV